MSTKGSTTESTSPTHLIPLLGALKPAGLRFTHKVLVDTDTEEALLLLTFQPRFTASSECDVWATLPLRGQITANLIADVAFCLIESVDVALALPLLLDHATEVGLDSPAVTWHKFLARHLSDHLVETIEFAEGEIHAMRANAVRAAARRANDVQQPSKQPAWPAVMRVQNDRNSAMAV